MKIAVSLFAAVVLFAGVSKADVLNFDGVADSGFGTALGTYQGFNFANGYALNAVAFTGSVGPNGYINGMTSAPNVYYNGFGTDSSISLATPGTFTLNSFELTAAWNNGLNVSVTGLANGVALYTTNLTVSTDGPTLESLNWSGIDTVAFSTSGGTPAGYVGAGEHLAIDDLTYNATAATPEPGSLALLSTGLGALGVLRKRFVKSV